MKQPHLKGERKKYIKRFAPCFGTNSYVLTIVDGPRMDSIGRWCALAMLQPNSRPSRRCGNVYKCLGNAYCSKSLNLQNGYCIPIDIYVYISYTVQKLILSNSIYTMMFIFVVLGTILFFQPYPNKSMKWQMSFEPRNCWKVLHQDSESAAQLPLTSEALMTLFSETLQV